MAVQFLAIATCRMLTMTISLRDKATFGFERTQSAVLTGDLFSKCLAASKAVQIALGKQLAIVTR
jgi:hypothetical protein